MNTLWVLAATMAVVSAEVGLGYNYKAPHTSYGLPSYRFGETAGLGHSSGFNGNIGSTLSPLSSSILSQAGYSGPGLFNSDFSALNSGLSGGQYYPSISSGIEPTGTYYPSIPGSGSNGPYYPSSLGGDSSIASTVAPINTLGGDISQTLPSFGQYQNNYQNTAAHKYQQFYVQQQQPPQVFKHFYVHSAPEEPEQVTPPQPIVLPPPQRHYKIIFVKTPAQQARAPQIVAVPQQHEEKTIVYVLSKKAEQPEVIVPQIAQTPPSKPEVYYVKYMNREDPQSVISNIVNNFNNGQSQVAYSGINGGPQGGYDSSSQSPFGSDPLLIGPGPSGIIDTSIPSSVAPVQISEQLSDAPVEVTIPAGVFGSNSLGVNRGSSGAQSIDLGSTDSSILTTGSSLPLAGATDTSSSANAVVSDGQSSSTASSISYDTANLIPTSQGLPHETYGPPKFRTNN